MYTVLLTIALGVVVGLLLRKYSKRVFDTETSMSWTVSFLILLFGHSIGSNESILQNLTSFGKPALIISFMGIFGSILFSLFYEFLFAKTFASQKSGAGNRAQGGRVNIGRVLLHSTKLPAILLLGVLIGVSGLVSVSMGSLSYIVLCALVFQVGVSLGNRPDFKEIVHSVRPRTLLLPLFTIIGTLTFTALAAIILSHSVRDVLTVGSGFGYYSLSSIIILDLKSATIGQQAAIQLASLSLIINMIRELVALVLCTPVALSGRCYTAISLAGINSMDVCLPMIVNQRTSPRLMPAAVIHGIMIEISVPLILSVLC